MAAYCSPHALHSKIFSLSLFFLHSVPPTPARYGAFALLLTLLPGPLRVQPPRGSYRPLCQPHFPSHPDFCIPINLLRPPICTMARSRTPLRYSALSMGLLPDPRSRPRTLLAHSPVETLVQPTQPRTPACSFPHLFARTLILLTVPPRHPSLATLPLSPATPLPVPPISSPNPSRTNPHPHPPAPIYPLSRPTPSPLTAPPHSPLIPQC
jgi:hypothetical protein